MIDEGLARLSEDLFFVSVVLYAAAMLAFALDQAARRTQRVTVQAVAARTSAAERTRQMASGGTVIAPPGPPTAAPAPPAADAPGRRRAGALGLVLTAVGAVVHTASVVTRGLAADRVPWGNMYEFSSAVGLSAVGIFLFLVVRRTIDRGVGVFVMLPVVLSLGLAGTVLYTPAGPLVPALDSYWIKIHVGAAILCSGAFMFSGVLAALYLLRSRYDERVSAAQPTRFPLSMGAALPAAPTLDRASYTVIAFAFPLWTFAIVAGAIWAEAAWGRYWGWDPKETWSFITWVLYAGYLHARATAGWKGRKAAWVAIGAALALLINYYVVNIFVVGLHSYGGSGAGLN